MKTFAEKVRSTITYLVLIIVITLVALLLVKLYKSMASYVRMSKIVTIMLFALALDCVLIWWMIKVWLPEDVSEKIEKDIEDYNNCNDDEL
ncbi:MAG: hypothetical protein IKT62_05165 [Firmicutes bacterium]|nr:hypothetical protein [Bacillota bacterium]